MRIPPGWRQPLADGRLLLVSPFGEGQTRATRDAAQKRNEFVASLADEVLIVYAAPGSKTLAFCEQLIASGKPVVTFDSPHNAHLMALGARVMPGGKQMSSPAG